MSEYDDELMREHDEEASYEEKECRLCGAGGLHWDQAHHDATGRWRLWEGEWPEGKPHRCAPRPGQAALDFDPVEEL